MARTSPKNFYLHYTQSEFGVLFIDTLQGKSMYGEVDYIIFIERDICRAYLSKLGLKQASVIGEQLLSKKFFTDIQQRATRVASEISKYKIPKLANVDLWDRNVSLWTKLWNVYVFCDETTWKPIEDILRRKYTNEQIISMLGAHSNKKIDNKSRYALEVLKTMGHIKLDLHLKAEKLIEGIGKFSSFFHRKYGINKKEFYALRADEIRAILGGAKVPRKSIKGRLGGCVWFKSRGRWICEYGATFRDWKRRIEKTEVRHVQGQVAYMGKVKGRVVKHLSWTGITHIPPGSVLVTGMTNPQMVPYLKNTAAIVTDEGGLTCHAAIISRELRIPCIIGTKNATKVLKDGDLVEVDANNGVVKIIKKARR
jgi:phosphoenolpyruvate synthase/pyruvate phosphate dikinase